jgi:hypothetical protein
MRVVEEQLARMWRNLAGSLDGPLSCRFVLQPLVVILIAIRAGLRDARRGKPLYFWAIVGDPAGRKARIREGWKDLGRVAIVVLVVDYIYQVIVFRWVYPEEGLLIAVVVALVPYLVVRGLVNRIGRRWVGGAGVST